VNHQINFLPSELTDSDLAKMFELHGTLTACHVVVDRQNNQSAGYGFVKFELEECAAKAVMALNGLVCGRKILKVPGHSVLCRTHGQTGRVHTTP